MTRHASSHGLPMQTLELLLQSCSLFCIDVSSRSSLWAVPYMVDLPGSHLIRAGYSLIASEPCLRLSFSLGSSEDGVLLLELQYMLHDICHAGKDGKQKRLQKILLLPAFCGSSGV